MRINLKIADYTKMNLEQLKKETIRVGEELLKKIDDKRYHNKEGIKRVKFEMDLYISLSKMQAKLEGYKELEQCKDKN